MPAVRFVVSLVLAISLAPIAYAQAPTRQPPPAAPGAPDLNGFDQTIGSLAGAGTVTNAAPPLQP